MKRIILFFSIFLLLPLAFAEEFSVVVEPIKDRIGRDETAAFSLTITNMLNSLDDYTLEFSDVGLWDLTYTDPLSDYQSGINTVLGRDHYTTRIYLRPARTTPSGYHTSKITVKSKNYKTSKTADMQVYIAAGPGGKEYLPNVQCSVRLSDKIDPRQPGNLIVLLTNRNSRDMTHLDIEFSSLLLKKNQVSALGPNEKKELSFPLEFDPHQPPQKDSLKTTIKVDQYTFICNKQEFEIVDYTEDFTLKSDIASAFLKAEETRTYTNEGNAKRTQRILEPTPLYKSLFTWSVPDAQEVITIDRTRYRAWEFTLAPTESAKIVLYKNYRPVFHLLMGLLFAVGLYYFFRAPVSLKKVAKNIELHEGGLSEVKIILSIKNRTGNPLEHVTIHDALPHLTQLHPEFGLGTMKPDKVMKHADGSMMLEWRIDEFDPYEERLITYKIKSNLRILGKFNLPPAVARYSTKAGRKVKVNSNRLVIGG